MNKEKKHISIHKLAQSFQKIYAGLDKTQLTALEEELLKMYPSEQSEVLFFPDYGEEENSMGLSIYVTHPKKEKVIEKVNFDQVIFKYLIRADVAKLPQLSFCIELLEQRGTDKYEVDFIPVFCNEAIDEYNIHFRITKNEVKLESVSS